MHYTIPLPVALSFALRDEVCPMSDMYDFLEASLQQEVGDHEFRGVAENCRNVLLEQYPGLAVETVPRYRGLRIIKGHRERQQWLRRMFAKYGATSLKLQWSPLAA